MLLDPTGSVGGRELMNRLSDPRHADQPMPVSPSPFHYQAVWIDRDPAKRTVSLEEATRYVNTPRHPDTLIPLNQEEVNAIMETDLGKMRLNAPPRHLSWRGAGPPTIQWTGSGQGPLGTAGQSVKHPVAPTTYQAPTNLQPCGAALIPGPPPGDKSQLQKVYKTGTLFGHERRPLTPRLREELPWSYNPITNETVPPELHDIAAKVQRGFGLGGPRDPARYYPGTWQPLPRGLTLDEYLAPIKLKSVVNYGGMLVPVLSSPAPSEDRRWDPARHVPGSDSARRPVSIDYAQVPSDQEEEDRPILWKGRGDTDPRAPLPPFFKEDEDETPSQPGYSPRATQHDLLIHGTRYGPKGVVQKPMVREDMFMLYDARRNETSPPDLHDVAIKKFSTSYGSGFNNDPLLYYPGTWTPLPEGTTLHQVMAEARAKTHLNDHGHIRPIVPASPKRAARHVDVLERCRQSQGRHALMETGHDSSLTSVEEVEREVELMRFRARQQRLLTRLAEAPEELARPPPMFLGQETDEGDLWIAQFQWYVRQKKMSEEEALPLMVSLMSPMVMALLQLEVPGSSPISLEQLTQALRTSWPADAAQKASREEFVSRIQRDGEAPERFLDTLIYLHHKGWPRESADAAHRLETQYLAGLHEDVDQGIWAAVAAMTKPSDAQGVRRLAMRYVEARQKRERLHAVNSEDVSGATSPQNMEVSSTSRVVAQVASEDEEHPGSEDDCPSSVKQRRMTIDCAEGVSVEGSTDQSRSSTLPTLN